MDVYEGPALDTLVKLKLCVSTALAENVFWLKDINSNDIWYRKTLCMAVCNVQEKAQYIEIVILKTISSA